MRAPLVVAALALAACGDGIYTAQGLPPLGGETGHTCNANELPCGPTQVCTPVVIDPSNCGACGKVCTGAPAGTTNVCEARDCTFECPQGLLRNVPNGSCDAATAVAAGGAHTCALGSGGRMWCWGSNASNQIPGAPAGGVVDHPFDTGVVGATLVAAGARHTCALVGSVVDCWGAVAAPGSLTPGVVELSAGGAHSCARLSNGTVTCWGADATPAPALSGVVRVTSGATHACALAGSTVRCWGDAARSKLSGDGLAGMAVVAAGGDYTCAASGVDVRPQLQCWGDNSLSQIPGGLNPVSAPFEPIRAGGGTGSNGTIRFAVQGLVAGRTHTCAFEPLAGLKCFGGDNALGQLGGATPAEAGSAVDVSAAAPLALAAGEDHTCAVFPGGSLQCWGANGSGQLGRGNKDPPATLGPGAIAGR